MSDGAIPSWLVGQGWVQVGELVLAFALSSLIGLERQLRRKSAGLRTQALVGTASALMLLISKYAFFDVLAPGSVVLDPSRIAAQIVSGIGFLGGGLILARRGIVRGLTTAAAVWVTAAIGMAAGGGLWLLALVVTALYFVAVFGYTAIIRRLPGHVRATSVEVEYADGRGVLRAIIAAVTDRGWGIERFSSGRGGQDGSVTVILEVTASSDQESVVAALAAVDGVHAVRAAAEDDD